MSTGKRHVNRRELLHKGALGGLGLASLGPLSSLLDISHALASDAEGSGGGIGQLIAAAKKEGHLNTIAMRRDWADYGEIKDTFQARYHIAIREEAPFSSSAEQVQAIISLKGQRLAPDVVDPSPVFADKGKKEGLYAPYKVATWGTIPSNLKDPHGYWTGDYWGVQSFLSNNNVVREAPKDWDDLLSPRLRDMVGIEGDPRKAGDAFATVMAASLANGGSLDNIEPGINFFARLKKLGNWNPTPALPVMIAKGITPIAIKWDFLNLVARDVLKGNATVTVPKHGVYGGYYCQAISKYAPHPNAAKLWEEYLFSDAGQLMFLKGYAHPARYLDLAAKHKIPASLTRRLPPASAYKNVEFATLEQVNAAEKVLQEQWGPKMGGS